MKFQMFISGDPARPESQLHLQFWPLKQNIESSCRT